MGVLAGGIEVAWPVNRGNEYFVRRLSNDFDADMGRAGKNGDESERR